MSEVVVVDRLEPAHLAQLVELFSHQWWTEHRTLERTQAALASSSLVLGAVDRGSDRLIGFTRVLSDGAFVALVLDVMVAAAWRGRGIGALLIDAVVSHPSLGPVESVELVCQPDLVPFYERWGFTDQVGASRLMRRTERGSLLGPLKR